MSWNEPGGDKNDPWSGRGDQKGPPDLDEVIRNIQEKLGGIFGSAGGGGGGGGAGGLPMKALGFGLLIILVLWALSGLYIVDEGKRGVVTRFGKYTDTTMAGLNWHLPWPIETKEIVDVSRIREFTVGYRASGTAVAAVPKEALMLTRDENIVDIRLAVQYQVRDARDFLFNVMEPEVTLKQVTESAQRAVVGKSAMDFVLTEGRAEIVAAIREEIQEIMDGYEAGVQIASVNLQDAQPPEEVQAAFEDAIKAREDQQRLINEAQAYFNEVIPRARGSAARATQEAEAYKATVIAQAQGESSRFLSLLTEYARAPEVTRTRLYLEAMESVLSDTNKVMIDVKGGNNLLYLPLDKLEAMGTRIGKAGVTDPTAQQRYDVTRPPQITETGRTTARGREGRSR